MHFTVQAPILRRTVAAFGGGGGKITKISIRQFVKCGFPLYFLHEPCTVHAYETDWLECMVNKWETWITNSVACARVACVVKKPHAENRSALCSAPPYRNNAALRTWRNYPARERVVCTTAKSESALSANFNFFFPSASLAGGKNTPRIEGEARGEKTIRKLGITIESHNLCPDNQNVIARYDVRTHKRVTSHRVKKKLWRDRADEVPAVQQWGLGAAITSRVYHNDKTAKV